MQWLLLSEFLQVSGTWHYTIAYFLLNCYRLVVFYIIRLFFLNSYRVCGQYRIRQRRIKAGQIISTLASHWGRFIICWIPNTYRERGTRLSSHWVKCILCWILNSHWVRCLQGSAALGRGAPASTVFYKQCSYFYRNAARFILDNFFFETAVALYYYYHVGKGGSVAWRQIGCTHLGYQDQLEKVESQ